MSRDYDVVTVTVTVRQAGHPRIHRMRLPHATEGAEPVLPALMWTDRISRVRGFAERAIRRSRQLPLAHNVLPPRLQPIRWRIPMNRMHVPGLSLALTHVALVACSASSEDDEP